jgi:hypothetical protein
MRLIMITSTTSLPVRRRRNRQAVMAQCKREEIATVDIQVSRQYFCNGMSLLFLQTGT